jgi:hypothetical protein
MSSSLQPRHKFYLEACVEDVNHRKPPPLQNRPPIPSTPSLSSSNLPSSAKSPRLAQTTYAPLFISGLSHPVLATQVTDSIEVPAACAPVSIPDDFGNFQSEAAAACEELLEICGRQEKELDRLRRELKISTSELSKWRQAFTVLPARRYEALTRLSVNMR